MFALLSSLYVSSDSIIMSQIQICVTANQKWMLTRDIFLPYVLCTFSFLYMVFISNFEVLEEWWFFFQISSLINLISMYFYTYLVKYSPYFVLSSTYFIFFLFYPAFFVRQNFQHYQIHVHVLWRLFSVLEHSVEFLLMLTTGFIKAFCLAPCQVVTVCCLCCLFQLHVVSF